MKKLKILNDMKEICQNLIIKHKNSVKEPIYQSIMKILATPNAFEFIDASTSLNILLDLGYTKEEAAKLYKILIN